MRTIRCLFFLSVPFLFVQSARAKHMQKQYERMLLRRTGLMHISCDNYCMQEFLRSLELFPTFRAESTAIYHDCSVAGIVYDYSLRDLARVTSRMSMNGENSRAQEEKNTKFFRRWMILRLKAKSGDFFQHVKVMALLCSRSAPVTFLEVAMFSKCAQTIFNE